MLRALAALLCLAALGAEAADFGALKPLGYVNDYAGVLLPQQVAELNAFCSSVEKATGVQMAFVLLPSLQGEPIEDVANLLFRKWGVGQKQNNEGLLLLIAVGDRRTRLEVGYGLEPVIPDGYAGALLRQMRPALRAGDFHGALLSAAEALAARIAEAKGVALERAVPARPRRPAPPQEPPVWLLAAGLAGLLLFAAMAARAQRAARRRRYVEDSPLGAWAWPLVFHDAGFPTRSSGGFGGFDSGDSFGGFGGGDSGGAGASSDW
ncbi:MAG: TPM domain-containing protein [Bryobacteraceae bacterium]|nr:TPM domain-containing protein [Bryobacteraceae bacterium]MCX7603799.1 TPM domain-containing protein [Bryobacteraceae bacterium]